MGGGSQEQLFDRFDYGLENGLAKTEDRLGLQGYALSTGIPHKLVKAWLRKQKPGTTEHLEFDELVSEAFLAICVCVHRFQAGKGSLFRYARMPVFEKLDIFRGESRSPVFLPQKVARKLSRDLHGEEYHDAERQGKLDGGIPDYTDPMEEIADLPSGGEDD